MEKIYAALVMKGRRTIDKVPEEFREEVKKILKEAGYDV